MKRVLFYSHSSTLYGSPTSLLNLVTKIKEKKIIECLVIVPQKGLLTQEFDKFQINYKVIKGKNFTYNNTTYNRKINKNWITGKIWLVKNLVQKILTNLIYLPQHFFLAKQFKPEIIYVNSSLMPIGAIVAKLIGCKLIWHHRETINDPETGIYLEWGTFLSSIVLNFPERHIYPSVFLKRAYLKFGFHTKENVVYNGTADMFDNSSRPNRQITFGMVGRLCEQKGQLEILEWLSEDESFNSKVILFGDGENQYKDQIRKVAKEVDFMGFIDNKDIYTKIDVLIINAKNESFGRVVAEANSARIPVIALASGALTEIVKDGVNGFLFKDKKSFQIIIRELINNFGMHKMNKLQESSRKYYLENFTIEKYAGNIIELLNLDYENT